MPFLFSRRFTERTVLGALVTGFALVVILLGAAGLAAVRGTRAIESSASGLVREQLLIARLLNEVQAEQDTLTSVLHQLTLVPDSTNRARLLRELEETDLALARASAAARTTSEAPRWAELERHAKAFSEGARAALTSGGKAGEGNWTRLEAHHDRVVNIVHDLLAASARRLTAAERQISRESRDLAGQPSILLGASLLLAALCAVVTVAFAVRGIRRIEFQANELNRVSWHMLQSQEEAARRFSHELHDELGQSLAAVKANLASGSVEDLATRRADCVHLVDEAIGNVRELSQLLRPVILDDFGLDAGLRWLTGKFAQRTRLSLDYQSDFTGRLADDTETHLYRIAQEALTNIARHSGATIVRIRLRQDGDAVHLEVEDNGRGIPGRDWSRLPEAPSLGIVGMRARARQAGGELTLSPVSPHGLRVDVLVPMSEEGEHAVRSAEDSYSVSG